MCQALGYSSNRHKMEPAFLYVETDIKQGIRLKTCMIY